MEIETQKTTTIPTPPLRLSPNAIKDFQKAYFDEYGVQISDSEANRLGLKLLHLFKAIYKPIPVKPNI